MTQAQCEKSKQRVPARIVEQVKRTSSSTFCLLTLKSAIFAGGHMQVFSMLKQCYSVMSVKCGDSYTPRESWRLLIVVFWSRNWMASVSHVDPPYRILNYQSPLYICTTNCCEPIEKLHYSTGYEQLSIYCATQVDCEGTEFYPQCACCSSKPKISKRASFMYLFALFIVLLVAQLSIWFLTFVLCICMAY